MKFSIITLFPEFFKGPLASSIIGRAASKGLVDFNIVNLRDYTEGPHRNADDYPYGGGCGMVMMPGPIKKALEAVKTPVSVSGEKPPARVVSVYMTPQGGLLKQKTVDRLLEYDELIIFCGHYEDIDNRARRLFDLEISVGDYVLSGGEPGALILVDSVTRKIPGALGNPDSSKSDSFSESETLFDCPHYTRPPVWEGKYVPEVLLSGDHKKINAYRKARALINTLRVRPDLLKIKDLTKNDYKLLKEYFYNYHCYED